MDDLVCRKLDEMGVRRVVLRGADLRKVARRALRVVALREACRRMLQEPARDKTPPDLAAQVAREMATDATISCDQAAFRVAERLLANKREKRAG